MDDIRNEHDIIENTDHFCGILLQVWSEGGRKDHFRAEFNAKTLAGYQIGDDTASTGKLGSIPSPEWDSSVGSIPVIEGICLWIFRQKSCGLSVHASILPESHQRGLQTSE